MMVILNEDDNESNKKKININEVAITSGQIPWLKFVDIKFALQ